MAPPTDGQLGHGDLVAAHPGQKNIQVRDTNNNYVATGNLGTFAVNIAETVQPTASVSVGGVTSGGGSTHQFTVTYTDNVAIDVAPDDIGPDCGQMVYYDCQCDCGGGAYRPYGLNNVTLFQWGWIHITNGSVQLVIPKGVNAKVTVESALVSVSSSSNWSQNGNDYTQSGSGPTLTVIVRFEQLHQRY